MAPSAKNHCVAGPGTAAASWPAANNCPGALRYIARSTMIGSDEANTADTSACASRASSTFTQMFCRVRPGTE